MTVSRFTTLLLDMDGTLIDSEALAQQAIIEGLKDWGLDVSESDAAAIHGKTWALAVQILGARYRFPIPQALAQQELFRRYRQKVEHHVVPLPGVPQRIRELGSHFELAVVSGSYRHEIQWTLERLGLTDVIPHYWGAEDYRDSKPSPEPYLTAMNALGRTREQCLIFEDSDAGMQSAIAAGMPFVAVTHTHRAPASLLNQAFLQVKHFEDLTIEKLLR